MKPEPTKCAKCGQYAHHPAHNHWDVRAYLHPFQDPADPIPPDSAPLLYGEPLCPHSVFGAKEDCIGCWRKRCNILMQRIEQLEGATPSPEPCLHFYKYETCADCGQDLNGGKIVSTEPVAAPTYEIRFRPNPPNENFKEWEVIRYGPTSYWFHSEADAEKFVGDGIRKPASPEAAERPKDDKTGNSK